MMGEAMAQAKLGRAFIMGKMLETIQNLELSFLNTLHLFLQFKSILKRFEMLLVRWWNNPKDYR